MILPSSISQMPVRGRVHPLPRGGHGRVHARVGGLRVVGIRCGTHRGTGVSRRRRRHDVGAGTVHPEPGVPREGPGQRDRDLGDLCGPRLRTRPGRRGLLLGVSGRSSIFWVNVPFGVAGIALTVTVVPESRNPDIRPVDVPGIVISAAGLLALTFGLIESSSSSWTSTPVWTSIAAGRAHSALSVPCSLLAGCSQATCGASLSGHVSACLGSRCSRSPDRRVMTLRLVGCCSPRLSQRTGSGPRAATVPGVPRYAGRPGGRSSRAGEPRATADRCGGAPGTHC